MQEVILEALEKQGWHISSNALEGMNFDHRETVDEISRLLLDTDLTNIGINSFPEEVFKSKHFILRGTFVVQLVCVKNISQPKFNSAKRGLLLLEVTDGKRVLKCLDYNRSNSVTMETPPGTKLKLFGGNVKQGILLIDPGNVQVLGGKVESLVEEWKVARRSGASRSKPYEEEAPRFEHFNPQKASRNLDLGDFSTFAILAQSQSSETQDNAESSSSRIVMEAKSSSQIFQNRDAVLARLDARVPEPYSSKRTNRTKHVKRNVPNQSAKSTLTLQEFEAQQHCQPLEEDGEELAAEFEEQLTVEDSERAAKDLMTSMFSYTPSQPQSTPSRGRRGGRRGRGRSRRGRR